MGLKFAQIVELGLLFFQDEALLLAASVSIHYTQWRGFIQDTGPPPPPPPAPPGCSRTTEEGNEEHPKHVQGAEKMFIVFHSNENCVFSFIERIKL